MKYLLSGKMTVGVSVEIEAESLEEAEHLSQEMMAVAYMGNGSSCGLVGLDTHLRPQFHTDDCYPEWGDIEAME